MLWKGRGKMKKIVYILGMSSLLFVASCSATSVKKPSKGKSVDKICFKYMTPSHIVEDIEISSNESFDDVFNKLEYSYYDLIPESGGIIR